MESEAKKIISFVFKRSGKIRLEKSNFYLSLSLDLKWFSPEKAKNFMNDSIKQNILIEKNNLLEPNFDIYKISIPFGYKPSEILYENNSKKDDNIKKNITNITFDKYDFDIDQKDRIIKKIDTFSNEKNIYSNVATLMIFKDLNIDISDLIKLAEDQLIND